MIECQMGMKTSILVLALVFVVACTKQPDILNLPVTTWIDQDTNSDTIIVKYSAAQNTVDANVYYAKKGWQTSTSPTAQRANKQITVYYNDSIYLSRNDGSTNYDGPYQFKFSTDGTQLTSQDLLQVPANSMGRVFVRLP